MKAINTIGKQLNMYIKSIGKRKQIIPVTNDQ